MSSDSPIVVGNHVVIPTEELTWRFVPSGSPGGQHANRSNTRAELSWDLSSSGVITDDVRQRLSDRLGGRMAGGVITIAVDETRSQWRNRSIARKRLAELIAEALAPETPRRPTRPTRASRLRRREEKRRRADTKRLRRRPERE